MNNRITILFSGTETIQHLKVQVLNMNQSLANPGDFIVKNNATDSTSELDPVSPCQGEFLP